MTSPPERLCRRFSLAEIELATHNFDEGLVIGQGGFGTVYKGLIDDGATTVALKRLNPMSKQGAPEFRTEIEMLSKFQHNHLVSLVGYYEDHHEMILVYEYMLGGNLADHLHKSGRNGNNSPLSWVQRLKICIDAARGLEYLHTEAIHRDVKSSNILLDENWVGKISDFGLSKIGPANQSFTHISTEVKGTFGYLDPQYFLTRRLTRKSDVYAFGVVLFEALCGRRAVDLRFEDEQQGLAGWAQYCTKRGTLNQIIDPNLRGQMLSKSLKVFAQIAEQCLDYRPGKRPTMSMVVTRLEFALTLQGTMDSSMTFTRKVRLFLFGPARVLSVHSNVKPSRNSKSKNYSGCYRALPNTNEGIVLDAPPRGAIAAPNLKRFTFAELESATSNFRPGMVLGDGGFARVFKGWVDEKTYVPSRVNVGMAIAVEKFCRESAQGLKDEQSMMKLLENINHPNLVRLLGYCLEDEGLLLVYEFFPKGTLDFHLFTKGAEPLPWVIRLKIAVGAARGLAFLHTIKNRVIHHKLTAYHILLDRDFNAKLSESKLEKVGLVNHYSPNSMVSLHPDVIDPKADYAPPEYRFAGQLSMKGYVYHFGVLLLEILTGLRMLDKRLPNEKPNLVDWAKPFLSNERDLKEVVDPQLEDYYPPVGAFQLAALALKCLEYYPEDRPSMEEVVGALEKINAI